MKVVVDTDSLVKLTKAKAKEIVLKNIETCIPPKVFEEAIKIPKEEGYPDALLIEENLNSYRVKIEDVDESTAIRQFIRLGVMWYVVELYKAGKITLGEAAELSGVSLRRMLDILAEHGVKGNVKMGQQIKALNYAKK
ncbi:MAG: UPF0175 family protein [Methanophagales archaeon]|nr:UPF0175 family protein [Methanophagales archaeon]